VLHNRNQNYLQLVLSVVTVAVLEFGLVQFCTVAWTT
jgi:hypothetical protein